VATSTHAVFFARVPPTVPYEELHELFSKYGTVTNLNLYRRWATAKTSKGCGLVEYTTQDEAKAAMDGLNGNYTFDNYPGSEAPIVVEWMDASRLTPPADCECQASKQALPAGFLATKSHLHAHQLLNPASQMPQLASVQEQEGLHTLDPAPGLDCCTCDGLHVTSDLDLASPDLASPVLLPRACSLEAPQVQQEPKQGQQAAQQDQQQRRQQQQQPQAGVAHPAAPAVCSAQQGRSSSSSGCSSCQLRGSASDKRLWLPPCP
jgi:hypothetical protein